MLKVKDTYDMVKRPKCIPPKDGWKEQTYYLVKVCYAHSNPIHHAVLSVGFLNDKGEPGSYSYFWNHTYEGETKFNEAFYVEVVAELFQIVR